MKKILILMIAILIPAILFGCAEKTENNPTTTELPAAGDITDPPLTDAPGTITTDTPVTEASVTTAEVTQFSFDDSINVAIGSVGYKTLSEACKNVKNGDTIIILKDFSENISLASMDALPCDIKLGAQTESCTIDGMNHTVTAVVDGDSYIYVKSGKVDFLNLNIVYSEGTKTEFASKEDFAAVTVSEGAQIVLENCNITSKWRGCLISRGGSITVKSGNYSISKDNSAGSTALFDMNNGSLTIEGGSFEHNNTGKKNKIIRLNGKNENIIIQGGTFISEPGCLLFENSSGNGPGTADARTVTINGGDFTFGTESNTDEPANVFEISNKGLTLTVNGGKFTVKNCLNMFSAIGADTTVNIAGGTFNVKTDNDANALKSFMSADSKAVIVK